MTQPMPVMLRAGRTDASAQMPRFTLDVAAGQVRAQDGAAHAAVVAEATTARTYLADISEFQPNIIDQQYAAWSKAIIIRAMYGSGHVDAAWYGGQRRDLLHSYGMKFLGMYQYVVASQDAAAQARALANLIKTLRPGEIVIADIEEGSGSQQARWVTWANTIHDLLGFPPWDYSGLYFARDHGLQPVTWVAAYQATEPSVPHQLWQFTDALSIPGIGTCDCSVYNGTVDQLAAHTYQGKATSPPPTVDWDWTSDGKYSLGQLASSHTTDVATLIWKTFNAHSQPGTFNRYVNAGNWSAPVPAGIVLRFPANH